MSDQDHTNESTPPAPNTPATANAPAGNSAKQRSTFVRDLLEGLAGPAASAAVAQARGRSAQVDQSRTLFIGGHVTGSNINLGDLYGVVMKCIGSAPPHATAERAQAIKLIEELAALLRDAPQAGVSPDVAGEAMREVQAVAEAAAKAADAGVLGTVKRTLRTLKGFADEFAPFPAIAEKYRTIVEQIGALLAG